MKTIRLTTDVQIKASGKAGPRVEIIAYTGGRMLVNGFGPVVIDLAGLKIDASVNLLADHDASLRGIIGAGSATVKDGQLVVAGTLAASSAAAQTIIALHKSGVRFQASVGVQPIERQNVTEIRANGRTIKSRESFTYVKRGLLREVSITALGADPETEVAIAARKASQMAKRNKSRTFVEPVVDQIDDDDTIQADDDTSTDPTINASAEVLAERRRIAAFGRITAKYPHVPADHAAELQAQAIGGNWTPDQFELQLLRGSSNPLGLPMHGSINTFIPTARAIPRENSGKLLTAALMLHAGRPDLAEKSYGERIAQQAQDLRCHSLVDICARALQAEMIDAPRDRDQMIRAAFSTTSLPIALGNLSEKSAADAFRETPRVWDRICRRRPVSTFHEHKIARVLLVGNFQQVANGGEIQHGNMTETTKSVQAATMGLMLGITRQHVVNDDLGVFQDTSNAIGRAAARTMNDDFASILLANAGSFFHANNSNLATGAGSVLSSTSLAARVAAMMKRTDAEGRNVDVRAKNLLVPPELEYTASQLLNSVEVQRYTASGTDNQPTGNPLSKSLDLHVEARLSNTDFHDNASATAWYLFATSGDGAVNIALLNGRDTPTIEQVEMPANVLGIGFRGYIDYGFALGEPLAADKSAGA